MQKMFALLMAMIMAVSLTACGGGNEKKIVGMWQIVDE